MTGTTIANLNLRKGPSTTYPVITVLPKGAEVAISGNADANGWYLVTVGEDTGYVSGKYLTDIHEVEPPASITRGAFLDACLVHLGKPYRWGGNGPANFDCSGYVGYVWRELGIRSGDYTADAMFDNFRLGNWDAELIDVKDAQLGDLVFFGTGTKATHVVFALSPGHVIGASGGYMATKTDADAARVGAAVRIDTMTYREKTSNGKDRLAIYRPDYVKGWK